MDKWMVGKWERSGGWMAERICGWMNRWIDDI